MLKVTWVSETLETSSESIRETTKIAGLVCVTMRGEVNSIPVP